MSFICEDAQRFLCGSCEGVARNAMILDCSVKHHPKQFTLYCSKCALSIGKHAMKCPFNDHLHPTFKPAIQQRLEMDELDVSCPYANKYSIAKQEDANEEDKTDDEVFLYDTDFGHIASEHDTEGMKRDKEDNHNDVDSTSSDEQSIGCEWIGKYKHLSNHLDHECRFIPMDHQILRMKTQFAELQHQWIQNKANNRWLYTKSVFCIFVIIMLFSAITARFYWTQREYIQSWQDTISKDTECGSNDLDRAELTKYIDDIIRNKYEEMEGFQYILKGDWKVFKNEIINVVNDILSDHDNKVADSKKLSPDEEEEKEGEEEEMQYAIIDDIVSNAKSTYDGYKKQIDSIPFVQFVSNAMHNFKKEKEL